MPKQPKQSPKNTKTSKVSKLPKAFENPLPSKALLKRVALIRSTLDRLYPTPPVPLNHKSAYQLLIAVLLSAQSTDKTVNRITPVLFARASSPQKMIKLSVDEIYSIIKPCGLGPKKAAAIHELSHILLTQHQGRVPKQLSELEKLPGVGHKTASVVVSQAFGIPAFAVDTHVHRLAARWGLSNLKNVKKTEADLCALFPKKHWSKIHIQMILFGREYCPAKNHDATLCPICSIFTFTKQVETE